MTGYNRPLALIKDRPLMVLSAMYAEAYPDRPLPLTRTGEVARDWILRGLVEYAERDWLALRWLSVRAKGER